MSPEADLRIAEFFVARPYRKCGIGRRLAENTLGRFHGLWQVNVLSTNELAVAFWRRVLSTDVRVTKGPDEVTFWPRT